VPLSDITFAEEAGRGRTNGHGTKPGLRIKPSAKRATAASRTA
jgi:hypothetical protein